MKTPCSITVNGQSLEEFLKEEVGMEATAVRIDIVCKLSKAVAVVNAPKTKRKGIGSGRGAGNPGVRKGRVFTREEVEAENLRRNLKAV
jgi:hypothetical protein